MIDSDVARLYHYKTKVLNLTVRRNIERFLEEFCFQLTENESQTLRFQIGTSKQITEISNNLRGGRRYLPLFERLNNMEYKLLEHDKKFDIVFDQLQKEENINQKIFFEGQIYGVYSLIIDIIKKANKKISIIDIQKFNKEYPTLRVASNKTRKLILNRFPCFVSYFI